MKTAKCICWLLTRHLETHKIVPGTSWDTEKVRSLPYVHRKFTIYLGRGGKHNRTNSRVHFIFQESDTLRRKCSGTWRKAVTNLNKGRNLSQWGSWTNWCIWKGGGHSERTQTWALWGAIKRPITTTATANQRTRFTESCLHASQHLNSINLMLRTVLHTGITTIIPILLVRAQVQN